MSYSERVFNKVKVTLIHGVEKTEGYEHVDEDRRRKKGDMRCRFSTVYVTQERTVLAIRRGMVNGDECEQQLMKLKTSLTDGSDEFGGSRQRGNVRSERPTVDALAFRPLGLIDLSPMSSYIGRSYT